MQDQLLFMESFVEDLLNLQMAKEGVFTLSKALFDPLEALNSVCEVFKNQAEKKGVSVLLKTVAWLPAPSQDPWTKNP